MNHFQLKNNELFCEDISIKNLAEEWGTPLYIYSHSTLCHHFRTFDTAFQGYPHLICFSVKANSNLAILRTFINEGGGGDVVSGGEIFRCLEAGIDPKKIVYSGVGKTKAEIDFALKTGILMFNIESTQELNLINQRAKSLNTKAPVSFRINPDIDLTPVDTKRSISRRHARIRREDDGTFNAIEDVGTMNGTFVNGVRLSPGQPVEVKPGDSIVFGTIQCQFEVDEE